MNERDEHDLEELELVDRQRERRRAGGRIERAALPRWGRARATSSTAAAMCGRRRGAYEDTRAAAPLAGVGAREAARAIAASTSRRSNLIERPERRKTVSRSRATHESRP